MASEKILIVEDETIVSENIKNILTKLGYSVSAIATTGEEAIRHASRLKPNLVLMDIKLKGDIDGIEAAEQIRIQCDIPVVYLTAFVDDNILRRAKITEPFGYIIKPFEIRDLHTNIEIALHKYRTEKRMRFSHHLLEITNQSNQISKMLPLFICEVKKFTQCTAAGIRLLNEDNTFPYAVSDGFPKPFIKAELKYPLKTDLKNLFQTTRITSDRNPSLYTKGGSFYINDIKGYIQTILKDNHYLNLHNQFNYQSAAMIPITVETHTLGILHIVDYKKSQIPIEILEVLEEAALQLGTALKRIQAEEDLKRHRNQLEELVNERTSALKRTNRKLEQEIIDHKKTAEALHESKSSFHNIVEKSGEGIVVVDIRGSVQFMNPAAKQYLGHISKHLIGKPFPYTLKNGKSDEIIINLSENTNGIGEIRIIETKWEGKKAHLVTILDITERKKIEQMKSDFVALVSHQLKTPVAEIKEFTDIMLRGMTGNFSEKQKIYLEEMYQISARNYRLISTLLDVSRIERKVIAVNLFSFEINEVIDPVIKEHKENIHRKGLLLNLQSDNQVISVHADKDKLIEALSNIVDNAVKFTDKGTITIGTRSENDYGYIDVTDTGTGINKDIKNKLFQKDQIFFGGPSTKSGCGLGLYIAREFLKLQNGNLYLDSTSKKGSHFTLKIPLSKKEKE